MKRDGEVDECEDTWCRERKVIRRRNRCEGDGCIVAWYWEIKGGDMQGRLGIHAHGGHENELMG